MEVGEQNRRPTPRPVCRARGLCYVQDMRATGEPNDPNDPLEPRADDPMLGRRWWTRLYDRPAPGASPLRTPLVILGMLVVLGVVALAVVWLGQR